MVIDTDAKDTDAGYRFGEFDFIIDRDLLAEVEPIRIDFNGFGFSIDSSFRAPASSCGGCGSSASCCS
ncbi:MAG: hypothetical protein JW781_03475 [Deltaproteobacteria bacterium]|nr:hypothetical protein [Candidatus Anaeroferrophillacea bacterium]